MIWSIALVLSIALSLVLGSVALFIALHCDRTLRTSPEHHFLLRHQVEQLQVRVEQVAELALAKERRASLDAARDAKRARRLTNQELEAEASAALTVAPQPVVVVPQSRAELKADLRRRANLAERPIKERSH